MVSREGEEGVIGCCLVHPRTAIPICLELGLTPEKMVHLHALYADILDFASEYGTDRLDILTLSDFSQKKHKRKIPDGALEKLFDQITSVAHLGHYVNLVLEAWQHREATLILQSGQEQLQNGSPVADVLSGVVANTIELTDTDQEQGDWYAKQRDKWQRGRAGEIIGYASRWFPLQNILAGYHEKEQTVIAARPSDGKTTLMHNEIVHLAQAYNAPCGIGSFEVAEGTLRTRMAGDMASVNTFLFRQYNFSDEDLAKMDAAMGELAKLPIYILDGQQTINQVKSWYINMVMRYGVKVFAFDYIQYLKEDQRTDRRTRNEIVAAWSQELKALAVRFHTHNLVLSQLNRGGWRNKDKTPPPPTCEALRDSGAIEQDADNVIFLYKVPDVDASLYTLDGDWEMIAEVSKNRNGPVGATKMIFQRSLQRFLTQEQYDEYRSSQRRQRDSAEYTYG